MSHYGKRRLAVLAALVFYLCLYVGTVEARDSRRKPSGSPQEDESSGFGYFSEKGGSSEDETSASLKINELFTTRRPKDLAEGVFSATFNVVKGAAGGAVAFVAFPIVGATKKGVGGFIAGAIGGTISGIILPAAGVITAAQQVIRGVEATPGALRNSRSGMVWDAEKREWQRYFLEEEMQELAQEEARSRTESNTQKTSGGGGSRSVKDRLYYNLLKVPTDATQAEIKRSYYKEARRIHPDKNPDDPDADKKFRELSTAYQILSDAKKRGAYDRRGASASDEMDAASKIDPYLFFSIMFGTDLVEPYVGELHIASLADQLIKLSQEDRMELPFLKQGSDWAQRKRELDIALNLRERVVLYVDELMTAPAFSDGCRSEAAKIAQGAFGEIYLLSIGSAMKLEASQFLGYHKSILGWRGNFSSLMKRMRSIQQAFSTAGALLGVAKSSFTVMKLVGDEDESSGRKKSEDGSRKVDMEDLQKYGKHALPSILHLAWNLNERDISYTIRGACRRLFSDASVTNGERLRRAEAVLKMGREFYTTGKVSTKGNRIASREDGTVSAEDMARAQVAFEKTVLKAQGQDVSRGDAEGEIKKRTKNPEEAPRRRGKKTAGSTS